MKFGLSTSALCSLAALSSFVSASPVPAPEGVVGRDAHALVPRGPGFYTYRFDDTQGTTHGTWDRHSNYGYNTYENTESVTHYSGASLHFANTFNSINNEIRVTVFATLKDTRGKFSVYCGNTNTLIGIGNEYTSSSGETNTQVVFSSGTITCAKGNDIIIKNDRGASHLAVDEVDIAVLVNFG